MSTAKKIENHANQAKVYADIFIEELASETGCSTRFLEEARPSVEKLYADVEGEALELCLDQIKKLVVQQSEVERCTQRSLDAVEELNAKQKALHQNLRTAQNNLKTARRNLEPVSYNVYSLGDKTIYKA